MRQYRAIFFVFDGGTGVGHLRRLARIARRLQGRFACLIVTGHRVVADLFVPEECEYIHIPSWDNLLKSRSKYWGREPFLSLTELEATRLRKKILQGVVDAFSPDVIFVDHLPLGSREELEDILKETNCLRYLVTRGVLNETEDLRTLILGGKAREYLLSYYNRILVAADMRIFDFAKQYSITSDIREKTFHVGYVAEGVSEEDIKRTREERGLTNQDAWVVASAGGGQLGESLIEGCCELAGQHPKVFFDIVSGPRSGLKWDAMCQALSPLKNLKFHKYASDMPLLHASADLVITSGGYNSLLEALQGKARILCFPFRTDRRDEQFRHAVSLRDFVDIDVSNDVLQLKEMFAKAIGSLSSQGLGDRRAELNFDGAANVEEIVLEDLGFQ